MHDAATGLLTVKGCTSRTAALDGEPPSFRGSYAVRQRQTGRNDERNVDTMEYITCDRGGKHEAPNMDQCDALRCVCGNPASAEGFFPVTTAGREIDADDPRFAAIGAGALSRR